MRKTGFLRMSRVINLPRVSMKNSQPSPELLQQQMQGNEVTGVADEEIRPRVNTLEQLAVMREENDLDREEELP